MGFTIESSALTPCRIILTLSVSQSVRKRCIFFKIFRLNNPAPKQAGIHDEVIWDLDRKSCDKQEGDGGIVKIRIFILPSLRDRTRPWRGGARRLERRSRQGGGWTKGSAAATGTAAWTPETAASSLFLSLSFFLPSFSLPIAALSALNSCRLFLF